MDLTEVEKVIIFFLGKVRPGEFQRVPENWKSQRIEDLALDSLDLTTLALDVEDATAVFLGPDDIRKLKTLGELVDKVESLRN